MDKIIAVILMIGVFSFILDKPDKADKTFVACYTNAYNDAIKANDPSTAAHYANMLYELYRDCEEEDANIDKWSELASKQYDLIVYPSDLKK